ncbi:MAG: GvpL/GvpF family gas vesicle protein, partial [Chloroflexota bacterium]
MSDLGRSINLDQIVQTELTDSDIQELVQQAKDDAITEAKNRLKTAFLDRIFALTEQGGLYDQVSQASQTKISPSPALDRSYTPEKEIAQNTLDSAEAMGYFIYGIARFDENTILELPSISIDPAYPLQTIVEDNFQAIVSRVSLNQLQIDMSETALEDNHQMVQAIRMMNTVIQTLVKQISLVPIRFGTVCHSEEDVCRLLSHHADALNKGLRQLAGKTEWGVKIYCRWDVFETQLSTMNPTLDNLQSELRTQKNGTAYLLQKQIDSIIDSESKIRVQQIMEAHTMTLMIHADHYTELSTHQGQGNSVGDLVFNAAFLVTEREVALF